MNIVNVTAMIRYSAKPAKGSPSSGGGSTPTPFKGVPVVVVGPAGYAEVPTTLRIEARRDGLVAAFQVMQVAFRTAWPGRRAAPRSVNL